MAFLSFDAAGRRVIDAPSLVGSDVEGCFSRAVWLREPSGKITSLKVDCGCTVTHLQGLVDASYHVTGSKVVMHVEGAGIDLEYSQLDTIDEVEAEYFQLGGYGFLIFGLSYRLLREVDFEQHRRMKIVVENLWDRPGSTTAISIDTGYTFRGIDQAIRERLPPGLAPMLSLSRQGRPLPTSGPVDAWYKPTVFVQAMLKAHGGMAKRKLGLDNSDPSDREDATVCIWVCLGVGLRGLKKRPCDRKSTTTPWMRRVRGRGA